MRPRLLAWSVALCVAASSLVPGAEEEGSEPGIVVEAAATGSAGERAGLQPGDVVLSWTRRPSPPANPAEARGEFKSPFDWMDVETEQRPRGEIKLFGTRDGKEFSVTMAPANWGVAVRPQLSEGRLLQYREAKRLIEAREFEKGIALWREVGGAQREELPGLGCWLFLKLGDALAEGRKWDEAHGAYRDALETARQGPKALQDSASAKVWKAEGEAFEKENEPGKAETAFREALGIWTRLSTASLALAASQHELGAVASKRGDLAAAEELHHRALATRERLAPGSLEVAASLNNLGNAARARGNLAAAEGFHQRALAIRERLAPGSLDVAASLHNLGNASRARGDLAAAEGFYQRALAIRERLAPGSLEVAASLNNLGNVAWDRGDLAAAEELYQRSLAIREKGSPRTVWTSRGASTTSAVLRGIAATWPRRRSSTSDPSRSVSGSLRTVWTSREP